MRSRLRAIFARRSFSYAHIFVVATLAVVFATLAVVFAKQGIAFGDILARREDARAARVMPIRTRDIGKSARFFSGRFF
jgi:hypothetical protein